MPFVPAVDAIQPADSSSRGVFVPLSVGGKSLGLAEPSDGDGVVDSEQLRRYKAYFEWLRASPYVDRPYQVGIETLARCNASCNFCPYPTMDRKGDRMGDALLDELATYPDDLPFDVNLTRVNEPFLDKRIFDVLDEVKRRVVAARVWLFTNASVLLPSLASRLSDASQVSVFVVSFNDHRKDHYERVMQLDYDRTVANIDRLHAMREGGELPFAPLISRVGEGNEADAAFLEWTRARWPLFEHRVTDRFNWMGAVQTHVTSAVPRTGCWEWFHVPVLASGRVAYCCLDHEGAHSWADINEMSILEAYNLPERRTLRERVIDRAEVAVCRPCNHFG